MGLLRLPGAQAERRRDLIDPIDLVDDEVSKVNQVSGVSKVNEVPKEDLLQSGMISLVPGEILAGSLIVLAFAVTIFRHWFDDP